MPSNAPVGTVTFLFSDIEGSTKLWETYPELMSSSLARHDAILRQAIEKQGGHVFKTVGDAFCAAFSNPSDAAGAALASQREICAEKWPEQTPIKVRIALNTGDAETRDGDYFGPPLNRAARLLAAGHGGQILIAHSTQSLIKELPPGATLRDLKTHRLKDLAQAEQVFQLVHPEIPSEFPPIKSLSEKNNNFPRQLTSFIGREAQLDQLGTLLAKSRLLTIAGPGGSGKTRLSLQLAANSLEDFPDGAWLIELAPLSDPELVPQAVAKVLGVREDGTRSLAESLGAHLENRRMLLVFDNCEHLLDASAKLISALISECQELRVLASSREALGLTGEQVFRVPSLTLPDPKRDVTPEAVSGFEAVQLFRERASAAQAGFEVNSKNAPALASLCNHLDGIPLAIELAAARVRSLSIEEIDGRLDQRFRLLTGGSRTALPRHQTLKALVDWSYDSLNESEKALLQRLSIFSGGWTLEAAEKVCADGLVEEWEVLDILTSLTDKSLVVVDMTGPTTRYRLLETVRQYSRDRLAESGDAEKVGYLQMDCFAAFAEESEPVLRGPEMVSRLEILELEHDNLRAAMDNALAHPESLSHGLRIAGSLGRFWMIRAHVTEGRRRYAAFLAKTDSLEASPELGNSFHYAGNLACVQSDYTAAKALFERAAKIRDEIGDRVAEAGSRMNLASVVQYLGDQDGARIQMEQSLAIFEELGDLRGQAIALISLGSTHNDLENGSRCVELANRGVDLSRQIGDLELEANGLNNLGIWYRNLGEEASSRQSFEAALVLNLKLNNDWEAGMNLMNLGTSNRLEGNHSKARELTTEGTAKLLLVGSRKHLISSLREFGHLEQTDGNLETAVHLFASANSLRSEIGSQEQVSEFGPAEEALSAIEEKIGQARFVELLELGARMDPIELLKSMLDRTKRVPTKLESQTPDLN